MLNEILAPLGAFLRSTRGRMASVLLIATGIVSIVIGVMSAGAAWVAPAQTLLVLVFVVGAALIYTPPEQYLRVIAIAAPALGAVILGITVLPQYLWVLLGASVGWIVAGLFLFRQQTPPEVMKAVRRMRKGEYNEALEAINAVIKRDRDNPEHYRLRAMILQLDDKPPAARRDYEQMLNLAKPGDAGDALRAEAYNGLSEVYLQSGRYEDAYESATAAHELFPDNWVMLYNLTLISDRLNEVQQAIEYGERAIEVGIEDRRQRLLTYLYLARAYARQGNTDKAQEYVDTIEHMWKALEELQKLIDDEQGAPLAEVLAEDVETTRALMIDELAVKDLR